jgi:hypothetical protein
MPLFTLHCAPHGAQRKTQGRVDRYSFLVRLFHPLLQTGLSRRTGYQLGEQMLFNRFETLMMKSIAQLEGKPLENGKLDYFKQELLKQFFAHFVSIRTLAPGLKLAYKGREDEITALASVAALTRACLEN